MSAKSQLAALEAKRAKKVEEKRVKSWSWSAYALYKECPLKYKLEKLDKIEEPKNEAMSRGSVIGKMAECFVKGRYDPKSIEEKERPQFVAYFGDEKTMDKTYKLIARGGMPKELKRFEQLFNKLRAQFKKYPRTMVVEDFWAFTKEWKVTAFNDWKNCVLRVKVDVGQHTSKERMVVIDWKTGKYREGKNSEYVEQLELYALAAFEQNPNLEEVEAKLCYLDAGVTYPDDFEGSMVFERERDALKLKKTWDQRTRKMLLDRAFVPRPNERCQWCHYQKANKANGGGQCRY